MKELRTNLHSHSDYSDGKNSLEDMVLSALDLDCSSLGLSDHSYLAFDDAWTMKEDDLPAYIEEVKKLKGKYQSRLQIYLGIEQDFYSKPDRLDELDYVIYSVHCMKKGGIYLSVGESEEEQKRIVHDYYGGSYDAWAEDYFHLLGQIPRVHKNQIIGHVDLITKFNEKDRLFSTQSPAYIGAWQKALDQLLEKDFIFEINTGAISRSYRTSPYPSHDILEYILKENGKITISSDCHAKDDILYYFDQVYKEIKRIGFEKVFILQGEDILAKKI